MKYVSTTYTMKQKILTYVVPVVPIVMLVTFSVFFYYFSPEQVISYIGVENAYIMMFILSVLGGLSTFSAVPYHIVLIALATGGVNPYLLGGITAVGVMLGDSTSYYIGYQGQSLLSPRMKEVVEKLSMIKEKYPKLLPVIFLLYGSLLPFSNDLVVIPMGFLHYPFWRVITPLAIGNIIFNIALALLAVHAYGFLQALPFF